MESTDRDRSIVTSDKMQRKKKLKMKSNFRDENLRE